MTKLVKLYIAIALLVILGSIYFSYQTIYIDSERVITSELQVINIDKTNWSDTFAGLSQFNKNKALGETQDKNKALDNTEQNEFDPNDISKAKLIGILLEKPAAVIVQLPKQPSITNNIGKTIKVKQGEQILDGWQLNVIDQTTIEWRHVKANTLVQQRLFENTDNKISESQ